MPPGLLHAPAGRGWRLRGRTGIPIIAAPMECYRLMRELIVSRYNGFAWAARVGIAVLVVSCGCEQTPAPMPGPAPLPPPESTSAAPSRQAVPAPINCLLPQKIRIHSFTRTGQFEDEGAGVKGIDVRIQAVDAFDDATKAFGRFRFELFRFKPNSADPCGQRLAVWTVDVSNFEANRRHWNSIMRTYQFKLGWQEAVPVGRKLVLTATFESPFTERLFDRYVFVSGDSGPL